MIETTHRQIIHDPTNLFGRWHVAGTEIAVAEVCLDYRGTHQSGTGPYRYGNLSPDEIAMALEFDFPAVRQTEVSQHLSVLSIACECGEDTYHTLTKWPTEDVLCVCGRVWSVHVMLKPKTASALHSELSQRS